MRDDQSFLNRVFSIKSPQKSVDELRGEDGDASRSFSVGGVESDDEIPTWDPDQFKYDYPEEEPDSPENILRRDIRGALRGFDMWAAASAVVLILGAIVMSEPATSDQFATVLIVAIAVGAVIIGAMFLRNRVRESFVNAFSAIVDTELKEARSQISNRDTWDGSRYVALLAADHLMLGMYRWPRMRRYQNERAKLALLAHHVLAAAMFAIVAAMFASVDGAPSESLSWDAIVETPILIFALGAAISGVVSLLMFFITHHATKPKNCPQRKSFDGRKALLTALNDLIVEYRTQKRRHS